MPYIFAIHIPLLMHLVSSLGQITVAENQEELRPSTPAVQNPRYRTYRGPLPKLPVSMDNPWIALHSPVKMYIPIRYTGNLSSESWDCVQCPKNLTIVLMPRQTFAQMPMPTLSICSSLARHPGRVHVAVASGPRPGQHLSEGVYPVEVIVWKAEGPVHSCQYAIKVKGRKKVLSRCPRPTPPTEGAIILCDADDGRSATLPANTVCQFFCPEGSSGSTTVVCSKGRWSPQLPNLSCIATSCPAPTSPAHGSWVCDGHKTSGRYTNGTLCKVRCNKGFVIPASQLNASGIECNSPRWNRSKGAAPQCKKAHLPKLHKCTDRRLFVKLGQTARVSAEHIPTFTAYSGKRLKAECILKLGANLPGGEHKNECVSKDPELGTRKKCRYTIKVQERTSPRPVPGQCDNRTVYANENGTHQLLVLFEVGLPYGRSLPPIQANCTPQTHLQIGNHPVRCDAEDPDTGMLGSCNFSVTVEERIAPSPVYNHCDNRTVLANENGIFEFASPVLFEVVLLGVEPLSKIPANCTPEFQLKVGEHLVYCEVVHPETAMLGSCDFWVTVQERSCDPLPTVAHGSITCNSTEHGLFPVLTVCSLQCDSGYWVAPDEATVECSSDLSWIPARGLENCNPVPRLLEGCVDYAISTSVPVNVTVDIPIFLTDLNETAGVICTPREISEIGDFNVNCTASGGATCQYIITVFLDDPPTSTAYSATGSCVPFQAPPHSSVVCTSEVDSCDVTCDHGYGFPGGEPVQLLECHDGNWSFEGEEITDDTMPVCMVQLESSAVQLWITFEAFSPHCDEEFQDQVTELVYSFCQPFTECLQTSINCTLDEERDTMLVNVNWTVQADFEPEDYADEEVPEAETRLESVLDRVRMFVTEGDTLLGLLQPVKESLRRGLMTLVCPDGFVANMILAKCVK